MSNLCNKRSRAFSPMSQSSVNILSALEQALPKLDFEDKEHLYSHIVNSMGKGEVLDKENVNPNVQKLPPKFVLNTPPTKKSPLAMEALQGMVVEVEGNIGSGKSTLLNKMYSHINGELGENSCEKFGEIVNNDFLGAFYSSPKKFGFAFQMYMLTTRLFQMKDSARQAKEENKCCFLDRGAVGDSLFAILSHKNGNMDDEEFGVYKSVCNERFPDNLGTHVDAVLYLDVDPNECHRRVTTVRKNEAESGIPLAYLDSVDECYFELLMCWLGGGVGSHDMNIGPAPQTLVLDWNEFGQTENALGELRRLKLGQRAGPRVKMFQKKPEECGVEPVMQLGSAEDVAKAFVKVTAMRKAHHDTPRNLNRSCSGCLATERELVMVDWNLVHDNAFRRVVMYWLARDASIVCYNYPVFTSPRTSKMSISE